MNSVKGKIVNYNESFNGEILFNKKIEKIRKEEKVDTNLIILPGYIDLHCHGGNGFDTMDGSESIKKMASYHLNKGTTTLLATTWTNTLEHTYKALTGFNNLINNDSNLIGVHLEGPFINPNKLGAQPPLTQKPSIAFIEEIMAIANIKVITLAPEIEDMENPSAEDLDNLEALESRYFELTGTFGAEETKSQFPAEAIAELKRNIVAFTGGAMMLSVLTAFGGFLLGRKTKEC